MKPAGTVYDNVEMGSANAPCAGNDDARREGAKRIRMRTRVLALLDLAILLHVNMPCAPFVVLSQWGPLNGTGWTFWLRLSRCTRTHTGKTQFSHACSSQRQPKARGQAQSRGQLTGDTFCDLSCVLLQRSLAVPYSCRPT